MEVEDMSSIPPQFKRLTNDELINFALQHVRPEEDELRRSVLQEHLSRSRNSPESIEAPAGDIELLRAKLAQLSSSSSA